MNATSCSTAFLAAARAETVRMTPALVLDSHSSMNTSDSTADVCGLKIVVTVTTVLDSSLNSPWSIRLHPTKPKRKSYEHSLASPSRQPCRVHRWPQFSRCRMQHSHRGSTAAGQPRTIHDNGDRYSLDGSQRSPDLDREITSCCTSAPVVAPSGDGALSDAHLMDFVGAIGESGPTSLLIHVSQRRVG